MREFINIVQNAKPYLFHTVAVSTLTDILRQQIIVPQDARSFVSLSERVLNRGTMASKQVTIAFDAVALREQVIPVEYTEDWCERHPDCAAYIAPQDWRNYFDALDIEVNYRRALAKAVAWKSAEMEHVGRSVVFSPKDVRAVQIHQPINGLRETLDALGYRHVKIGANLMERILAEIEMTGSHDEFIDEFAKYFTRSSPVASSGGMACRVATDMERIHLGLFDQDKLIAYLCAVQRDHGWQIGRTLVHPHYRNTGRMRFLLDWFVTNKGALLSDGTQTPEAKAMWTALIRTPGRLKLFCFDPETRSKTPIRIDNDRIHPDPWEESETLILAEDRNHHMSQEMRESREDHRRKSDRVINWYGEGSDQFPNP